MNLVGFYGLMLIEGGLFAMVGGLLAKNSRELLVLRSLDYILRGHLWRMESVNSCQLRRIPSS